MRETDSAGVNSSMGLPLPRHLETLLACVKRAIGIGFLPDRVIAKDIDWSVLLGAAGDHGLLPLVTTYADSIAGGGVPQPTRQELRREHERASRRAGQLAEELRRTLAVLAECGIPALVVNVPAVGSLPGAAPLCSVDTLEVFVRRRDVLGVKEPLRKLGYRPRYPVASSQRAAFLRFQDEYRFTHEVTRIQVSFRWRLGPRWLAASPTFDDLWQGGVRQELGCTLG